MRNNARIGLGLAVAALALAAGGCRQGMYDQPKVKPLAESAFFDDGAGARPLPPNTVARGFLRSDRAYWTGLGPDGQPIDALPMPVDRDLLRRGEKDFNVFCSPCHDRTGSGNGMIVRRGFKQPPSFYDEKLRRAALGHFVNVITEGFGQMPSYASQVPVADRWAVAAYVRALQRSHAYTLEYLSVEERSRLEAGAPVAAPPASPAPDSAGSDPPEGPLAQ